MVQIRTRPKDALLLVDALVRDAVVIGESATRGDAKLFQNVGRILKRKILTTPQTMCDVNNDVGITTRLTWRINAFLPVDDASLGAASKPVFLFVQTSSQHDVRMMRRLRHEEVDHPKELQLRQRFAREVGIGKRNQGIEAHRQ